MTKIAVIDKCPSGTKYEKYFDFDFDLFHLCSTKLTKVLKKDVDMEFDESLYDFVVLVGSEAAKYVAKLTGVTDKAGHLIKGTKYIPMTSPAILSFKPEAKDSFAKSLENMHRYINGESVVNLDGDWRAITETHEAIAYLRDIFQTGGVDAIALDTETTSLYPRDGYVLGISISARERAGAYIDSSCIDEECVALLQDLIDSKMVVFHNGKFDMKMLEYHFNLVFHPEATQDTLLLHYNLDETQGSHGLKQLAMKYTTYGDYDKDLDDFKKEYCRLNKVSVDDFTYDLIPFDVLSQYAAIDTACTLELFNKFYPLVEKNPKLKNVNDKLLVPGMFALKRIEEAGIPFDKRRLEYAQYSLGEKIREATERLYSFPELRKMEEDQGKIFNPNSVQQLRVLLFDYLGLPPTGKLTGTGAISTDAEVLEELSDKHPLVQCLIDIRKKSKLKNTYADKLITSVDRDGRIRTFFNLTSTTSGRLSSSGKFNAQQIPRDDPIIKGCIKARPGYKIVSQDLATAEMYLAAVLSGDKNLMAVFKSGGDFHSSIAHMVFNLPCKVEEVKELYKDLRQAAKSIK